jgi:SAM-dependent methyltransferase
VNFYPYPDAPRSEVIPFLPLKARRFLDIGCGFGGFGSAIKAIRPNVYVCGVEPSEEAAAVAASRLDHVFVGDFPDDVPRERFDCLVFNDVLEHLVDPWSALRESHQFLEPNGRIVASIPNVRYLPVVMEIVLKGDFRYRDEGVLDRTHVRFFTKKSMVRMFDETGFVVESTDCLQVVHEGTWKSWLMRAIPEGFGARQCIVVARQRPERVTL